MCSEQAPMCLPQQADGLCALTHNPYCSGRSHQGMEDAFIFKQGFTPSTLVHVFDIRVGVRAEISQAILNLLHKG